MSSMAEFRAYRLAQMRIDNWRSDNATELRQLGYQEMNQRIKEVKVRLEAEAEAEIAAEEATEARRLTAIVRSSPLAAHVQSFFTEEKHRTAMDGERDAQIAAIKADYAARTPRPRNHIDAYNQGRLTLLMERITAAGLTMCSGCHSAKPDVQLVYIDGVGIGSVSDCMSHRSWFEPVSNLRSLCQECRADTNEAPRTAHAEGPGTTYRVLHAAEERSDGTYALFDGAWVKDETDWTWQTNAPVWRLVPATVRLNKVLDREDSIGNILAEKWDLPPRLRSGYPGGLLIERRGADDNLPLTSL